MNYTINTENTNWSVKQRTNGKVTDTKLLKRTISNFQNIIYSKHRYTYNI